MSSLIRTAALCAALVLLLPACSRDAPSPAGAAGEAAPPAASAQPVEPPIEEPADKRPAGQERAPTPAWRAFGTEPFWGTRVQGEALVFTTPDNQAGTTMQGQRVPAETGFVFAGRDGDREFRLDIAPGDCSDGMSDNRYDHVATFRLGDTTYKGCAEAAK